MRPPDFWTRHDVVSQLAVMLLTPFGWLYGASVDYRVGHTESYRSSAKVVCVGNLTAGGTGKTPIAMEIARILIARGARPVFLTRGYGGRVRGPAFVGGDDRATHVGDEPVLLAGVAPVVVSRDRAAGAKLAEEHGFDVIIMDDGHQNFTLAKDLSFIVVDAESGFANNPKAFGFLTLLAMHYYGLQRRDDMLNVLNQIKSHAREFDQAYLTVGDFYLRMGDGSPLTPCCPWHRCRASISRPST